MTTRPNAVGTALDTIRRSLLSPEMKHKLAVALSGKIDAEKFAQVAMVAISKNPDLIAADRDSLFIACMEAAADGLLPNGKDAALIAYGKKVQYQPMIRGVYKIAQRSGAVRMLNARIVRENDLYEAEYGLQPNLRHVPATKDPGKVVRVYAAVILNNGLGDFEPMTVEEVERVRSMSKAPNSPAWKNSWEEMAKKTAVHRLCKRLDLAPELEQVVNRIESDYDIDNEEFQDVPAQVGNGAAPRAEDFAQPEAEPSDYELYDEVGACVSTHTAREWTEELMRSIAGFGKANAPNQIERVWTANQGTLDRLRAEGFDESVADVTNYYERWKAGLTPKQAVAEPPPPQDEQKVDPDTEMPLEPDAHPEPSQVPEGDGEPAWVATFRERLPQVKTEKALDSLTKATFKAPLDALAKSDRPRWEMLIKLVDAHRDHLRQQMPR